MTVPSMVYGRPLDGIARSNFVGGMDVCLSVVSVGVVRYRSLRLADPSSKRDLPSVVCLSVISKPQQRGDLGGNFASNKVHISFL